MTEQTKKELSELIIGKTIVGIEWANNRFKYSPPVYSFTLSDGSVIVFSASGQSDVSDVWFEVKQEGG